MKLVRYFYLVGFFVVAALALFAPNRMMPGRNWTTEQKQFAGLLLAMVLHICYEIKVLQERLDK